LVSVAPRPAAVNSVTRAPASASAASPASSPVLSAAVLPLGVTALGQQLAPVVAHIALEALDLSPAHDPQPVGRKLDQVRVVGDQDHRPLVAVDRLHQRLTAVDVQMVGRLVHQDDVRRFPADQREQQPCLLPARQIANPRLRLVLAEAEPTQLGANHRLRRLGHERLEGLQRGAVHRQLVGLMLGKITDLELARFLHQPRAHPQPPGEHLEQGRLAVAVGAEQGNAIIAVDAQINALEHRRVIAVADLAVVDGQQRRGQRPGFGEVEGHGPLVGDRGDGLHPRQHLQPRLRLPRLGRLVAEAIDEAHDMGALGLLLLLLPGEQGHALGAGFLEKVVVALVGRQRLRLEVQDIGNHRVEQGTVVADDQDRAAVGLEIGLQPQRGLEIEVVGRLVEQQQVGLGEQQRGKRHPHPPAPGEGRARLRLCRLAEAQSGEDPRCAGRGGGCRDVFEPGVNIGNLLGRQVGAFERVEQAGPLAVGVKHGIDQRTLAAGSVLRGHAHGPASGELDVTGIGGDIPADQPQQGRFSRAVAPDQPDPVVGVERRRTARKDGPSGDAVGQV